MAFLIGFMLGGLVGVVIMSLLCVGRVNRNAEVSLPKETRYCRLVKL